MPSSTCAYQGSLDGPGMLMIERPAMAFLASKAGPGTTNFGTAESPANCWRAWAWFAALPFSAANAGWMTAALASARVKVANETNLTSLRERFISEPRWGGERVEL